MNSSCNLISLSFSIVLHICVFILFIFILPSKINNILPSSSVSKPPLEVALINNQVTPSPLPPPVLPPTIKQTPTIAPAQTPSAPITPPEIKLPEKTTQNIIPKAADKPKVLEPKKPTEPIKKPIEKPIENKPVKPIAKVVPKQSEDLESLLDTLKPNITTPTPDKATNDKLANTKTTDNLSSIDQANHTKILKDNYANAVINQIRPYVIIPEDVTKDMKAVVEVLLLPNMQIKSVRLLQSSGNLQYDTSVTQAILRQDTFPPLPAEEKWTDYKKILLTFHPH